VPTGYDARCGKEPARITWEENVLVLPALDSRFEVSTAVTMKNAVFWDVTPCGSCTNLLEERHVVTFQETAFFRN
jgi:hypothetical protein